MANWNDRWVIPHDGGWAVAKDDRERVSARFDTQAAAIERGREIVRNAGGGELTVLAQDGASGRRTPSARATTTPRSRADGASATRRLRRCGRGLLSNGAHGCTTNRRRSMYQAASPR
jgi:hypothetical protein